MSASETKPLRTGAAIPAARLTDFDGKATTLKAVLGGKPTVLVFYRGGWCPYCNIQLADLRTVQPDLSKLGYQMVAISPDGPVSLKITSEKNQLTYRLFSDTKAEAMIRFGVAWKMSDNMIDQYKKAGNVDIERYAGGATHHILPVPSVFLIDKNGKISYVFTNADYRVRLKGSELVKIASKSKK